MNITIKQDSASMVSANWTDETHRYHVWIRPGGRPEDTIHKNQKPRPDGTQRYTWDADYEPHRALDLTAKRWTLVRDEIRRLIASGAIETARAEYEAASRQAAEDAERKRVSEIRDHLNSACEKMASSNFAATFGNLANFAEFGSADEISEFWNAVHRR